MIETHHSRRINDAQRLAHQERADAFRHLVRAVPRILSTLRHTK